MLKPAAAVAVAGLAGLAYGIAEAHAFCLRQIEVACLAPGSDPMRLLHVSDLHLTAYRHQERDWIASLAAVEPDFVAATGDFLGNPRAVPAVVQALDPLLGIPGAFVFGSNDYYYGGPKNPLRYLVGPSGSMQHRWPLQPTGELELRLRDRGWRHLANATASIRVDNAVVEARGVDDPHIRRDDYEAVAGAFPPGATLRLALAHAPYRRVIDAMAADGADLVLAGHTHGGQVRLPGYGALVTNCDLPRDRVRGLSRAGAGWLHVSAGLGTSPFTPFRIACRPEATLLTLTPRRALPTGGR